MLMALPAVGAVTDPLLILVAVLQGQESLLRPRKLRVLQAEEQKRMLGVILMQRKHLERP